MVTVYKKYDDIVKLEFDNQVTVVPCDYGDGQGAILTIPDGEIWNQARQALDHLQDAVEPVVPEPFR